MQKRHEEYPERLFCVKVIGKKWYYAETCLHFIQGNKSAYFSTTNQNGCDHDTIKRVFPELRPLVALHLADADGLPMYALENGFYHYAEGIDENGKRIYHESEEARQREQERREENAFSAYMNKHNGMQLTLLSDIWHSVSGHSRDKKEYVHYLFRDAQHYKSTVKSTVTEIIVTRNNQRLASHLRITEAEAKAIPANLTKEQFNNLYVLPNVARWKEEADNAILFMQSYADCLPGEVEQKRLYGFLPEMFKRWKDCAWSQYRLYAPCDL